MAAPAIKLPPTSNVPSPFDDVDPEMFALLSPDEQQQFIDAANHLVGGETAREFVARVAPTETIQRHMAPLVDAIEQARVKPIRLCIDYGPGSGKTTVLMRLVAWWLEKSPADLCGYVTYSDAQARDKADICKQALVTSGRVALNPDKNAANSWRTAHGGGLVAAGAGGGIQGKRVPGLLVYDDPYKDIDEARSPAINGRVINRFKGTAFTRLQGGSIVVVHTRWAMDDLIGYILKNLKWDNISVPSLCDAVGDSVGGDGDVKTGTDFLGRTLGEPAWPEKYPYELCLEADGKTKKICGHDGHLKEIRITLGEHLFASMYQGKPRPLGTQVFHEPSRYLKRVDFPNGVSGKRGVISVDPAATAKTSADFSVIAVVAMDGFGLEARMWVWDLIRGQWEIPELVNRARRVQMRHRWLVAVEAVGGFKAVPQQLRMMSAKGENGEKLGTLRVVDINPGTRDKFARAQAVAAAWNDGRVLVPSDEDCEWADGLIERFQRFTGVSAGELDDEVDAVAQAWNLLYRERGTDRLASREG